jgi:hypothetical protein
VACRGTYYMYTSYAYMLRSFILCASCAQQYLAPARADRLPQLSIPLAPNHLDQTPALHNTAFTPRTRIPFCYLNTDQSRNPSLHKGHSLGSGSSPAGVVIHPAAPSSLSRLRGTSCRACIVACQPRHPIDQPAIRGKSAAYTKLRG